MLRQNEGRYRILTGRYSRLLSIRTSLLQAYTDQVHWLVMGSGGGSARVCS